jgi:NADH:ubiquinone oxidoreductase subunit D
VLVCILVFRAEPWQRVLIKHINIEQSIQILEPHQEYSNQSPAKSTSREITVKRKGMDEQKASSVSIKRIVVPKRHDRPKFKLTKQYQADSIWDNPNDFWNMTYEERSKVGT